MYACARVSVLHAHNVCARVYTQDTQNAHTLRQSLTYNSKLCVGVDLAVLIPSHTLVHSCVGEGQPTD